MIRRAAPSTELERRISSLRRKLEGLRADWDRADRTGQPVWPISKRIGAVQAQIEELESKLEGGGR